MNDESFEWVSKCLWYIEVHSPSLCVPQLFVHILSSFHLDYSIWSDLIIKQLLYKVVHNFFFLHFINWYKLPDRGYCIYAYIFYDKFAHSRNWIEDYLQPNFNHISIYFICDLHSMFIVLFYHVANFVFLLHNSHDGMVQYQYLQ